MQSCRRRVASGPAVAPELTWHAATGQVTKAVSGPDQPEALRQLAEGAVQKWAFASAQKNGQPVVIDASAPVAAPANPNFDQSKLPPELRYDTPPRPTNTAFAVYPFELLRDNVEGTAEVRFLVSPSCKVEQAFVIKATRPLFGQAFLAMLDEWRFRPAMKDVKPTWAVLDIQQEFSSSGGDAPVSV